MMTIKRTDQWRGLLSTMPVGVRITLTALLLIIGAGYLVAVLNIYHQHRLADGKPDLSIDDVRAIYSGLTVQRNEETVIPSRMLTMIQGAMREYIDDDEDFEILETWLKAGGTEAGLDDGPRRKTPRRALIRNCMRCHAQSTNTDISKEAPFGPDEFEVDYGMLTPLIGTATESSETTLDVPPQYTLSRLVLVSHIHMLSIPMFTLVVALMFMMTRWPAVLRTVLTPVPMLALVFDFAGWWLARLAEPFVFILAGAGGFFGLVFGLQIIAVLIDMWRPASRTP